MKITLNVVLAISFSAIALLVLLFVIQRRKEGFEDAPPSPPLNPATQGTVPAASQTSAIPTDVAAATTTNPSATLAQPTDIQALADSFNTLKLLILTKDPSTTDLDSDTKSELQNIKDNIPSIENSIKTSYTNPDITGTSVSKATEQRTKYDSLTTKLRNAHIVHGAAAAASTLPAQNMGANPDQVAYIASMTQPTLVAAPPSAITLEDLKKLRERINTESLNIANSRSQSPTMLAKQNQLEDLAGNLTDMISRIERGTMAIQDVPVTKDDADNFLHALDVNQPVLPALHLPNATNKAAKPQSPLDKMPVPVNDLLKMAKQLKWSVQVNVSHDPDDQNKNAAMERLDKIETTLNKLLVAKLNPSSDYLNSMENEMNILKSALKRTHKRRQKGPTTDYNATRNDDMYGSTPEYPSAQSLDTAQETGLNDHQETFPTGEISPDVFRRPGYAMNDEQIQRRASASVFDPASVGSPDWKERSQNLCRQVASANLGDPASFGCIGNPNEVGPQYSWKGNYTMVCNRIGDTWGAWYPEMFGCPKYNPQQKFSMLT